jgi:hypothetical protein
MMTLCILSGEECHRYESEIMIRGIMYDVWEDHLLKNGEHVGYIDQNTFEFFGPPKIKIQKRWYYLDGDCILSRNGKLLGIRTDTVLWVVDNYYEHSI